MIFSRIQKLSVALNQVNNKLINKGVRNREELFQIILEDAAPFEKSLLHLTENSIKTSRSNLLTQAGQQAEIIKLQQVAREQAAKADKTATLAEGIAGHEKALHGLVTGERRRHRPAVETILTAMQSEEIRRTMTDLLRQAKADHEAMVEKAEAKGEFLPERMRVFHDPTREFYLSACNNYDGSQEAFMRSLDQAPWPLGVIDQETIAEGTKLLEQRLAPEEVAQLEAARIRLEAHAAILAAAEEIIQSPTSTAIFEKTMKARPDKPGFTLPELPGLKDEATA